MNRIEYVDSFAYISNLDPSITKLNNWLRSHDFEFTPISIFEFQDDFGDLFYYRNSQRNEITKKKHLDRGFLERYFPSAFSEFRILHEKKPIILFKHIEPYEQPIINNTVSPRTDIAAKKQKFLSDFMRKLRLFKNGNISLVSEFEIYQKDRHVSMRTHGKQNQLNPDTVYKLAQREMKSLYRLLNHKIELNKLNEIALLTFESSYGISNDQVRFITLVTALESLFNFGKEQISHTISRHLSLIVSKTKAEFESNYKSIKKIYHKRSSIVHGGSAKIKPEELVDLENLVRRAIIFTLYSSFKTKEELFNYCNSKGYRLINKSEP